MCSKASKSAKSGGTPAALGLAQAPEQVLEERLSAKGSAGDIGYSFADLVTVVGDRVVTDAGSMQGFVGCALFVGPRPSLDFGSSSDSHRRPDSSSCCIAAAV
mmetsp:Transcript_25337/g.61370  ORF Transcript_25337/g.61370 Transcript_25337/m.61370 type:complete len:103 (-) Transcript_25337:92-400(-)